MVCKEGVCLSQDRFGKAEGFGGYPVHWIKLSILKSNLSKNKCPKCYIYIDENRVSFLCCDCHGNNYKDSELRAVAKKRLKELVEYFKSAPND